MTVEAVAAIVAALISGSVALLGFGLDSLIELASACTILWLFTGIHRDPGASERRAQQIIAGCFAALALYLAFDSIGALASDRHLATSWLGVGVAAGAIVFMPLLATTKGRVAAQLSSVATAGDAAQSWLCAISAAAVLLSILTGSVLGWRWIDPITGIGIAALAVHEGRKAWAGEVCADCAPIGFQPEPGCEGKGCC